MANPLSHIVGKRNSPVLHASAPRKMFRGLEFKTFAFACTACCVLCCATNAHTFSSYSSNKYNVCAFLFSDILLYHENAKDFEL